MLARGGLYIWGALILINLFFDENFIFAFYSLLSFLLTVVAFIQVRDKFAFFLITHPAWIYIAFTYFYAAFSFKPVTEGLNAPDADAFLALIYTVAAISSGCLILYFSKKPNLYETALLPRSWDIPLIAVGLITLVLGYKSGDNRVIAQVLNAVTPFFWIGMSLRMVKLKQFVKRDVLTIGVIVIFFATSFLSNARTPILSISFFLGVAFVIYAKDVFNWKNLLVGYFMISTTMLFSDISLDVRSAGANESGASALSLYSERLLRIENVTDLIFPFWKNEVAEALAQAQRVTSYDEFRSPYYTAGNSLANRLVVLPQMDIIVGRLGEQNGVNWSELWNTFISSLPDFGQNKDLIFSDRLTWDLRLRIDGIVGRPMVTSLGEFYAMGGASVAFVCLFMQSTLYIVFYRLLIEIVGSRVLAAMLLVPTFFEYIFSTTALSTTITVDRIIPTLLIVCLIFRRLGRQKGGLQQGQVY